MLLVIDNYDSFTYNLVQYLGELGAESRVIRNDAATLEEIEAMRPTRLVISPGPCAPAQAGLSNDIIRRLAPRIPTLGVCLGHQCMGEVCGGEVVRAPKVMHGKTSTVHHRERGLFAGISNPFEAARYHSLIVRRETFPDCLEIEAWTEDNLVMALSHREWPMWGVQFHPESILTTQGKKMLRNFLETRAPIAAGGGQTG
jgi:anthranilate synthase/aminodeoxychorismate synthase-like glutamine amidotransferase